MAPIRAAPELAVGHHLEAHVLLQLHHLGDRPVLDLAEPFGRDLALAIGPEGVRELGRPQQAADVLGPIGRPQTRGAMGSGPAMSRYE